MEESADETHRVEAAMSPPMVGSPPQTRARQEAAQGEEEEAERSADEKAAPMEVVQTPPASPPSPPQENPGQELFPNGQDPILPEAGRTELQEAVGDESARLAEELHAAAHRAAESAKVKFRPLAV